MTRSMSKMLLIILLSAMAAVRSAPARSDEHRTSTATDLAELTSFLRDYHRALAEGDAAYLSAHTVFPLSFSTVDLNMEVKVTRRTITSAANLLRVRDELLWPDSLVAANPEAIASLRQGIEKCDDPIHPDVPNWREGEQAYQISRNELALTYLEAPCEAETHRVTLRFRNDGGVWRLHDRKITLGP